MVASTTKRGSWLYSTAIATALAFTSLAGQAGAQTAAGATAGGTPTPTVESSIAAPQAKSGPVDQALGTREASSDADIIVTGSRIKRNGYQAPSPETVVTAADIASRSSTNVADYLNTLPQAAASSSPRTGTQVVNSGTVGSNFINLRGLGANRTLILLDGRRVSGASVEGLVDINTLPSALLSRVDIVTGGASAAYGSDAVAGVVNFILDRDFTGLSVEAQGGISTYGDDAKRKIAGAFGTRFADGRGHILLSGTITSTAGVEQVDSRPWFKNQKIIPNPAYTATNGQPQLIKADNAYLGNASVGGLITSGVLAGTQFGQGGTVSRRVFGTPAGAAYSIGGEPQDLQGYYSLEAAVRQQNVYGRVGFDILPGMELFAEAIYGHSRAISPSAFPFQLGNLTLRSDNAFLPADLRAQLGAAGQATFAYGTLNLDVGRIFANNERSLARFAGGLQGELGGGWKLDSYVQYGRTDLTTQLSPLRTNANYTRAIDTVTNPATGQIVCRSTLTNPSDGCVPFNVFGFGVNSPAAMSYVRGTGEQILKLRQFVAAGSVQGEPVSTWAGPVSVAVGAEYRREEVSGSVDPISQANGFFAGNYKATNGTYNVKEAFAETIVPLARETTLLKSLDFNAAVRYTDYSTSGGVVTWKAGGTWEPFSGLRLRMTRSRDIRAPNLGELYLGGQVAAQQTAIDNGRPVTGFTTTTVGNTDLRPEKADTLTAGIVVRPAFLGGLVVSVDYYNVSINDAILTLSNQQIVDNCNAGNLSLCSLISRDGSNVITAIRRNPVNVARERAKGLDIEASDTIAVTNDARIVIRALASHVFRRDLSFGTFVDRLDGEYGSGAGSIPTWRVNASVGLETGPYKATVTGRYVSPGKYDQGYTAANLIDNHLDGATYYDLALSVGFGGGGVKGQFFFNVDNVFNKDPVIVYPSAQPFLIGPVNAAVYDTIGREFRAGIRFKL